MDFLEYVGALSPWATFNVHRKKDAPFFKTPEPFMLRARGRSAPKGAQRAVAGAGAVVTVPGGPPTGMRWAKPGERPPSKFAPGQDDGVIARFDAYMKATQRGGPRYVS